MKTTLDLPDALLDRARQVARSTGRPLRALVEEGLRRVLDQAESPPAYRMEDASVGDPNDPDPLEGMSWQEIRAEVYGEGDRS